MVYQLWKKWPQQLRLKRRKRRRRNQASSFLKIVYSTDKSNTPSLLQILVVELSEEQKQMIVLSEDFQRFVLKAGRVVERALWEQSDIYTDYIGGYDTDEAM